MPFSQQTIDFLFENRLHDNKAWFLEHKGDYTAFVTEPFAELVNALAPTMAKIDPQMICDPKKLSRIYRDARYARDSIFRDEVWYTFARPREDAYAAHPGFWVSISTSGLTYGCGYYSAGGDIAETIRRLIIEDAPPFTAAFTAAAKQRVFTQYGEFYKKDRFPDQPPEKRDWLNRRSFGFWYCTNDPKVMFSEALAQKISRDFKKIAPVYDFYIEAEKLAAVNS